MLRNFLRNISPALETGQRGIVLYRTRCRPRAVSVQSKRFAHMKDVFFGYIDEQTILASICRLQSRGTRKSPACTAVILELESRLPLRQRIDAADGLPERSRSKHIHASKLRRGSQAFGQRPSIGM